MREKRRGNAFRKVPHVPKGSTSTTRLWSYEFACWALNAAARSFGEYTAKGAANRSVPRCGLADGYTLERASGWAIRKGNAEPFGRGSHGAVRRPQPQPIYERRRQEMHIDPTEAGTPQAAGFQELTHLRFRGDGHDGQHFQVSNRFGAFMQVPARQFSQDKGMEGNALTCQEVRVSAAPRIILASGRRCASAEGL